MNDLNEALSRFLPAYKQLILGFIEYDAFVPLIYLGETFLYVGALVKSLI